MANKGKRATYRKTPPLPFQGNKSIGRKKFIDVIQRIRDGENRTYVDLFGGSFYLSYLIHQIYPNARIICNDYDNYMQRICEIQSTQDLIKKIREVVVEPRNKKISPETKAKVNDIIDQHQGFIDLITLSSNLLYSSYTLTNMVEFLSHEFYNILVKIDYDPNINDYIEGIEFRQCDWKALFDEFKDEPNVVFIADPPYLYTDRRGYAHPSQDNWDLAASLKVLEVLTTNEYIYYGTTKSGILDYINFLRDEAQYIDNFESIDIKRGHINKKCKGNTEFMLYKLDLGDGNFKATKPSKKRRNKKADFEPFFNSVVMHGDEEDDEDVDFNEEVLDGEEEEEFFDEEEDGELIYPEGEEDYNEEEEVLVQVYNPDDGTTTVQKMKIDDLVQGEENQKNDTQ